MYKTQSRNTKAIQHVTDHRDCRNAYTNGSCEEQFETWLKFCKKEEEEKP